MNEMLEKVVSGLAGSGLAVTPTCPRCKGVIPSEDINVANDVAYCRSCNLSHRLSALTLGTSVDENVDVNNPPPGTWYQREMDSVVIGATHRSLGQAIVLLFICLFWNGIVSVFVTLASISTLRHLGIRLPEGFPLADQHSVSVGMTIFLWLFLTPFIAVGLALLSSLISSLAGRTELRIQGGEGVLFTGAGPLGRRKRFSTSEVRDVRIEEWTSRGKGGPQRNTQIVLELETKPINFGSMLTDARRRFVAGAAKKELVRR